MIEKENFEAEVHSHIKACLGSVLQRGEIDSPGPVLLVALSGGADSTALLSAAASLRRFYPVTIRVIHVDHGIRPAAERALDRQGVRTLCRSLGVGLRIATIPPGRIEAIGREEKIGIEAAARKVRHRIFRSEFRRVGAALLLVGHTADDELETLLWRLLRGAGPRGLGGLPVQRGFLCRPLIGVSRQDVLAYLAETGLSYRTDSTNADTAYLRNRIRLRLIPLLNREFPFWRSGLLGLGQTQRKVADFLGSLGERQNWRPLESAVGRGLSLSTEEFDALFPIVREETLFYAIDRLRSHPPPKENWNVDSPGPPVKEPRRAAIRTLCEGRVSALDLGDLRIDRRENAIRIYYPLLEDRERGWSFQAQKSGSFPWAGGMLVVEPRGGEEQRGEKEISCDLPVVFRSLYSEDSVYIKGTHRRASYVLERAYRSRYTDICVAEDRWGVVAIVGSRKGSLEILVQRDKKTDRDGEHLLLSVISQGEYVGRSK